MEIKRILVVLFCIGVVATSCKKDDENAPEAIPPRLLADQTIEDDAAIKAYLESHYYNYQEFENPPEGFDFKIRIDTITSDTDSDIEPLSAQVEQETVLVSSSQFGLTEEENDIAHTLYYLDTGVGEGERPTVVDSVYLKYEGSRLDGTIFDSNIGAPIWLDLQGTLTQANPGTITGFKRGLPKFKSGSDIIVNDDGTFEIDNFGVGLIFMPSGLAYFGGTQPGQTYAPLIFNVQLLIANTADHDRDGVPSIVEDLDGDGNPVNDNTDEENDFVPNYLDTDDDNDGILTRQEIEIDAEGNVTYPDSDGDGIPDYLDPDNS
ncbi:hypothetical protein FGM00_10810 [Aggregatimonas sangjinii]|uniref:peptidylprolyl isomerase n=1 Tax=Aggregatimonas sangjinii TaxID=2583587 RepID=A0A5B7SU23_9FLAO|nr:hypothetical protein [Aggregatimonas sangjinii]QCX00573.1 hypothetical protein FGM00_10810 [Aggregatimonas sangjinii]